MPEVPDSCHHGLVEVEIFGVDVKTDDVGAANACEQHQGKAAPIEKKGYLSAVQSVGPHRAHTDNGGAGNEDHDRECVARAVI